MITAEILYEDGCPNYSRTCEVLCEVISAHDLEVEIVIKKADTSDHQFMGSPTLLIDNIDVESCYAGSSERENPSFHACRIFNCTHHLGCPSAEMIECTLRELQYL